MHKLLQYIHMDNYEDDQKVIIDWEEDVCI